MRSLFVSVVVILFVISGCKTCKKTEKSVVNTNFPGPPTIVYKTKQDYSKLVPVILSADKSAIVNYPAVDDISVNGNFPLPTLLKKGYYLDNRGIGPDVAFTRYSYEEYARLKATPSVEELYSAIIDKAPLTEMYDCGNRLRFSNIESELNNIIDRNDLEKKCTKLK